MDEDQSLIQSRVKSRVEMSGSRGVQDQSLSPTQGEKLREVENKILSF